MLVHQKYTGFQLAILVLTRILIGWYFLYEGIVKLLNPDWSSLGYLLDSKGFMEDFFISLATNTSVVSIIDMINIWGLIAIGLGLILGLFTRIASISGIVLLCLYYLSHPAFIGAEYALPSEGNYLWINKTILEISLLLIITIFPTGRIIGIDRFFTKQTTAKE
ncbi:MAG: DoxX subfamily [Bacteroidetes bacterium RBG_13_42_15]|nr:MAG: DoxX subfamily [Bacteroidetes bacterium RBG_13_42_15]HJX72408.1 DoxX family membrane protein [Bacteroidales bacterium]